MKTVAALACVVAAACVAQGGALDELLPVPVKTEARGGFAPEGVDCRVRYVEAEVPGARAETADEAYVLDVGEKEVVVTSPTARGRRWAEVTLAQLRKLSGGRLPLCRIVDWPKFRWRGFMHDSGRNFLEIEHVKGIIDAMSRAKMNLFHWHLTEYYGWRLESKKHPELQRDASFYLRYVGKFYTQDEFREIVDYAATRGVTVMPEFDIPGHALAFRRAFGFETMRDEGVREKLCDLVDELCSLAPADRMPFIHLGSDEARLPEEKVPPQWLRPIVERIHANGRTVVGWTPGELAGLTDLGPTVGMRWGKLKSGENDGIPGFDACGMYIDTLDPFEILPVAANRRVCPWPESEGPRHGAITCAWHDDFAGEGRLTLRNQAVLPALVMFGDAFWRGRDDAEEGSGRAMLQAGDRRLAAMAELERRVIAQRDKVYADLPYPFHFVAETPLRWRVSLPDGTLVARDLATASIFLWHHAGHGLLTNRTGTVVAETWIKASHNLETGAWIGFTDYTRNHGRAESAPTPKLGEWNKHGATVELNGVRIDPPRWRKPGQVAGADVAHLLYVRELDEIPFEDEEYYMREPTRIRIRKGWNHVKLTIPMTTRAGNHAPWVGTFVPVDGTTDRPCEVPGLEYSADPQSTAGESEADAGWRNRSVAVLGDSISDPRQKNRIYWQYLGEWLGWNVKSFGVSGAKWNDMARQIDRLERDMGDDVDAILILMGTNDYQRNRPLGKWYDETPGEVNWRGETVTLNRRTFSRDGETVRGSINLAMERLRRRYPRAQIVVMTPPHRGFFQCSDTNIQPGEDWPNVGGVYIDAYVDCIREVGKVWSVPLIDLNADSGLMPLIDEQTDYFRSAKDDRLHPNSQGHERLARTIWARLKSLPGGF